MTSVKTPSTSGKRRRGSDRSGRRFNVKESNRKESDRKRELPSPATLSRKARKVHNAFRLMAMGAMFFVVLSTVSLWRARALKQRMRMKLEGRSVVSITRTKPFRSFFSFRRGRRDAGTEEAKTYDHLTHLEKLHVENTSDAEVNNSSSSETSSLQTSQISTENPAVDEQGEVPGAGLANSENSPAQEEALSFEELPERIEWYSRDDFKDGSRPMCRISKPCILSNGTILVPDWMAKYEKLLHRCGLGTHSFYSTSTGPEGLERTRDIAADFALTIHPERFQEPTHVASVYLTEHILKSSYLFDVFGGDAQPVDGVNEHHCYTTPSNSTCTLPRPVKALLKPAIFVPKRIETAAKDTWTRQLLNMFGVAHGHGHEATHLNASTILINSHQGKSENLVGTCFRSILTTDGMFRHLPPNGLQHSNFFSEKNGVAKGPKQREAGGACQVSIGIASSGEEGKGIDGVRDLKEKIEVLSKIAIPGSSVEAKVINFSPTSSLENHIKEMQDLDIYLGASGDEMSSIGFLRSSSSVFELMPFGVKPNTHESLARALGIHYSSVGAKPQIDSFKRCIDGEVFNLRKKGTLAFTEQPDWHEPLIKAWDEAVGEFVLSGSSNFDLLTAEPPIKNYYSRVCGLKQKVEVGIDEVARKIILVAKNKCSAS